MQSTGSASVASANYPEVTPARLRCDGRRGLNRLGLAWAARLADRVRQRIKIVLGRALLDELLMNVHHVPATRRREPLGVLGTKVVGVGFGLRC